MGLIHREPKPSNRPAWHVVATTYGLTEAQIIAGRLDSLGIPNVIHRESAGAAFGLQIGPLGQAQVLVPETHYKLTMATLYPDDSLPALDDGEEMVDDSQDDKLD
ncbi:MAG: putative signal transducing protein [Aggregatilineales bacterium]